MDRRSLVFRLLRAKFTIAALAGVIVSVVLLVVVLVSQGRFSWQALLTELALGLFTGSVVGVVFQYVGVREMLHSIRDSAITAYAADPDTLAGVSPDVLDQAVVNILAARLGNRAVAAGGYANLRAAVTDSTEVHRDTRVSITFTPWDGGSARGAGAMFVATIRWQHTTPAMRPGARRFACVSDPDVYRSLLRDPAVAGAWLFEPAGTLDASSPEVFHLIDYRINGTRQPIQREQRAGGQWFTVTVTQETSGEGDTAVDFTYRALVPRHGHALVVRAPAPSQGIHVDFDYSRCGIWHAAAFDFLTGARDPRVLHSSGALPVSTISVGHQDLIMPTAGVVLVWTFDHELHHHAA